MSGEEGGSEKRAADCRGRRSNWRRGTRRRRVVAPERVRIGREILDTVSAPGSDEGLGR